MSRPHPHPGPARTPWGGFENPPAGTAAHRGSDARRGSALFLVLIVVLLTGILGIGLLRVGELNRLDAARRLDRHRAFWSAEAGLAEAHAAAWSRKQLKDGTLAFPEDTSWLGTNGICRYEVAIRTDATTVPPAYAITVDAHAPAGAAWRIASTLRQTSPLALGLFGDRGLRLEKEGSNGWGSLTAERFSPAPPGAEERAVLGSNAEIDLTGCHFNLTGKAIFLGADALETVPANLDGAFLQETYESISSEVGHIDPDPLGLLTEASALRDAFLEAAIANDNAAPTNSAGGALFVDGRLVLGPGENILPGGVYLLAGVEGDEQGGRLEIGGAVVIYITAPLELDFPIGNSDPRRLVMYSPHPLTIDMPGDFAAFVYAPDADLTLRCGGGFFGGLWAGDTSLTVGGNMRVCLDLQYFNRYAAYGLATADWQAIRRD